MAAALASCVDTEKPVFQTPTTFTVNTPAMQDQLLVTNGDQDSKAAFMLVCSQPDYGFATKCSYNAQVSLTGEFKDAELDENGDVTVPATYISIPNQESSNAHMRLKCFDLAAAMCELLGINRPKDPDWDPEQAWADYVANGGAMQMPVYFRATSEIPGVKGSFIASSNTVTYNKVTLSFAIPAPGFIFIVGDQSIWTVPNDPESGTKGTAFATPSEANKDLYENYKLIEPEIGCKLYAGTFFMPPTEVAHPGATNSDYNTQWRYFTELVGWDQIDYEIASKKDNFFVDPVTSKFSDGMNNGSLFKTEAVHGDGSWGVLLDKTTAMTHAVSLEAADKPIVWVKVGEWDVAVGLDEKGLKEPVFSPKAVVE